MTAPRPAEPHERSGPGGPRMSFLEHLDELRRRLTWAFAGVIVGVLACWAEADRILAFLLDPIERSMGPLAVIRPAEAFMNKIKAAFVGGLFVGLPWVFYQLWRFVSPGLYPRERRWVIPFVAAGSVLFLAGAAFCYAVAMPAAVGFLASQGARFRSSVTVDSAFSFATKMIFGLGLVFELPLAAFLLARLGLVTPRWMWRKLDIAVFVCFLAAAVLTPTPDVMTMTIFALPMIALYLLSIAVAFFAAPRRGRRDRSE
ncbi:MAG: twin-arginine translocase subunit TatC [Acidobacteria bacterium]|nr:MAG: twin-arginine translocase subunit TatC [Acidobacteriota bacterium]